MANILSVENISKAVGDRSLFENITFGVGEGEKIGVVARNGTGKSTLLSILAGTDTPDTGTVIYRNGLRIGYLPQQPDFNGADTVREAALAGDDPRARIVIAYELALAAGNEAAVHAAVQDMDTASAWDYQDKMHSLLSRLGLSDAGAKVAELSGGQRKRLAIARIVMMEPDMLLLDEPTNHLDIDTIEWLEAYLGRSRATLLMVTHDRYFLDRVCNRIFEMDNRSIYSVAGNYDMYLRRRAERIEAMEADVARARNTLRREQEWMSRQPQARAGKAKYRIDAFYDLKERARGNAADRNVSLDARSSRIGSKIFEARNVCKKFGDKVILDDFTYTFARGEKVGIVGANGVGKSTFIKMLMGLVPYDSGEWELGSTLRFGYYSQDGIAFDNSKRVVDAVNEIAEDISLAEGEHIAPMQYLQKFLFSPADQQKYIYKLSGGERCRLHLATVLMRRPNFLILDEPTNDLDIVTLGILEEYLSSFDGCVIVVSHDRFFLDSIVDHIFVMEGNGVVKDFPGNYSEYRAYLDAHAVKIAAETPKVEKPRHAAARAPKMSFRERKEFEALEAEIEALGTEKKQLEELFSAGNTVPDMEAKAVRYRQIADLLDEKEMRWLELSEKE